MSDTEQEVLQKHLAQFLVKDVFNTITADDILKLQDGEWTWKGKKMVNEQVVLLKEHAKAFSDSMLWKVLKAELLHLARKNGFEESQTVADQIASKMLAYLTLQIDKKLKSMLA